MNRILAGLCGAALVLLSVVPAAAATSHPAPVPIANVQVSHDSFLAHSEPAIAENPRNPNNLIAGSKFFTDPAHYRFKIGTYYSMNGGRSWHDSGLLPGFAAYGTTSDVSIAFSSTGVAYVSVLATDGVDGCTETCGIFVSRSSDDGKTFSNPVPVFLDTTGTTFSDKPWIGVDQSKGPTQGTIYVAWNLDSNQGSSSLDPDSVLLHPQIDSQSLEGVVVSRSTDGGNTFSAPLLLAPFTQQRFYIGAQPAVGPDGKVSIAFASISSKGVDGIDLVQSSDGGLTFSAPRAVAKVVGIPDHLKNGTFRNLSMPTFAVSPHDRSMVVAWADQRNGDADILESRSLNGGATWSTPRRVNDDRLRDGKDQFQPALAVAPNGEYTLAWFDRRYDSRNRLIDEVMAQSRDDGATFSKNVRVTTRSWNPAIDAPRPGGTAKETFIGDYQALAVDNSAVHPLWNDTQNGVSQQIRTAVVSVRIFVRR